MIAPDLIQVFNNKIEKFNKTKKKSKKYMDDGGDEVLLVMPDGLYDLLSGQTPNSSKDLLANYNFILNNKGRNNDIEIKPSDLWKLEKYKNNNYQTKAKCQLKDMKFRLLKCNYNINNSK